MKATTKADLLWIGEVMLAALLLALVLVVELVLSVFGLTFLYIGHLLIILCDRIDAFTRAILKDVRSRAPKH